MKVLICGAGRAARTTLAYMGENWDVTVVDNGTDQGGLVREFESVSNVFSGDASSPVVLERAGIRDKDWVLALTSDDDVNLAVVRFARESGVRGVVGRAVDPKSRRAIEAAGARAFSGVAAMAQDIVQHLRNPRVRVIPVARDSGQVLEIEVASGSGLVGRTPADLDNPDWSVAAVFRAGHMLRNAADQPLVEGDLLIVATEPGMYNTVCSSMECVRSDFPHSYGRNLVAALSGADEEQHKTLLAECMHVVQGTGIEGLVLLADGEQRAVQSALAMWSESVPMRVEPPRERTFAHMESFCNEDSACMAMVPWAETSILRSLVGRTPVKLAHSLPCPLLVAKGSEPYRRILVPFTGSERTRQALDAALQLASDFGAEATVVLVREPGFLTGDAQDWVHDAVLDARAVAQERGMRLREEIRDGNPVLEVIDLARDYDLVVLGSRASGGRAFLTPDVGEHIVDKSPCSVLVITK